MKNPPAYGSEASAYFHYDTNARRFILYSVDLADRLWLFDPLDNQWINPKPRGDVPAFNYGLVGYYDPERNVLVHYNSMDVFVYRTRKTSR